MKFKKVSFAKEWKRASPSQQAEMLEESHWTDGPSQIDKENNSKMPDYDYYGS